MKSALGLILGVSVLATTVGCDSGTDDAGTGGTGSIALGGSASGGSGTTPTAGTTGVIPTAGTSTGGTGSSTGGTGGGELPAGVALTPTDGWIAADSNTLGVQGAMFEYADPTSLAGPPAMTKDFTGTNACITGVAAKVDMMSTACTTKMFTPPATDCYGEYWGAAIGLNLNQPTVAGADGTEMGGDPMPFDASKITAFAFEVTGAKVPTSLRFKAEDASGEYCTGAETPIKLGANVVKLDQLRTKCWAKADATSKTAEMAKTALVKIAWQVVTNDKSTVPFEYCVANVRAITAP